MIYNSNCSILGSLWRLYARVAGVCFLAFMPLISWSQTDSLMHYLEIASKNNPAVIQKFTEYKAALQKVPQVGSLPDPELTAGVFLQPMELMEGYQVADLRLMQMFPWFGVLKNAKDEMSLMAKAKFESFRDTRLSLFYDVRRTYYELSRYQQEILISESSVEILKTIERLTLVRFKSPTSTGPGSSSGGINPAATVPVVSGGSPGMQSMGSNLNSNNNVTTSNQSSSLMEGNPMGSQTSGSGLADLYRIQIEIGDLENNIGSLKNLMVTVTSRFNTYLNRPVMSPVILPDTLKPVIFNISLAAITDSMLTNNPMLGMLKFEQQSLDARYRMVTNMGYPMVGVGVNYSIIKKFPYETTSMNGKDMIMPMITLTLPVYRKKYNAMKSEVELQKTATAMGYQTTSNSLQAEYYQAVQLFQDAQRRRKLYTDQYLLADKSLGIMLKSFSTSGSELTDILRIRQQTLDYKFKQVEAVADYNTAVAWLKRLMAYYQLQ
jgi:outer membrane protein TolC